MIGKEQAYIIIIIITRAQLYSKAGGRRLQLISAII